MELNYNSIHPHLYGRMITIALTRLYKLAKNTTKSEMLPKSQVSDPL